MDYTCRNTVIQNMRDFGCDEDTIAAFLKCFDEGDKNGQRKIINEFRKVKLEELHKTQKEIDLIDYMIYQLGKCDCLCKKKKNYLEE